MPVLSSTSSKLPWQKGYEEIEQCVSFDADDLATEDYSVKCSCQVKVNSENGKLEKCFDNTCPNWETLTECVDCDSESCMNQRIQRNQVKKLEVKEVDGKGYGLFCLENKICKGDYIREYVGELVSKGELDRRLAQSKSSAHLFVMELKDGSFVDSRHKASISRFINHSCEPNCTIEVWTVHQRLRAAIFALQDIYMGEELCFDYQWAPCEGRPPTRCFCGTKSCRGYIEVFDDAEHMRDVTRHRTGQWVTAHIAKGIAERENKGGEWLVDKRVKIWWDGNDAYFQADVLSYDPESGQHNVCYLVDNDVSSESLWNIDTTKSDQCRWQFLDESKVEKVIGLKKVETNGLVLSSTNSKQSLDHSERHCDPQYQRDENKYRHKFSMNVKTVDKTFTVDASFCSFVVKECQAEKRRESRYGQPFSRNDPQPSLFAEFCDIIRTRFDVRIRPISLGTSSTTTAKTASPSPQFRFPPALYKSSSNCQNFHSFVIFGEAKEVASAGDYIEGKQSERIKRISTQKADELAFLDYLKPLLFTGDWRMTISESLLDDQNLESLCQFSAIGLSEIGTLPVWKYGAHRIRSFPSSSEPFSRSTPSRGGGSGAAIIQDTVYMETVKRFIEVVEHLDLNILIKVHAMILLQRILASSINYSGMTTDVVALISSTLILSLKSLSVFSSKVALRIITAAYGSVFRRQLGKRITKDSPGGGLSPLEMHIEKTFEMENKVLLALEYDLYVSMPIGLSREKTAPNTEKSSSIDALALFALAYKYAFYEGHFDQWGAFTFLLLPTDICILACIFIYEMIGGLLRQRKSNKASGNSASIESVDIADCHEGKALFAEMLDRKVISSDICSLAINSMCQLCGKMPLLEVMMVFAEAGNDNDNNDDGGVNLSSKEEWEKVVMQCCEVFQAWLEKCGHRSPTRQNDSSASCVEYSPAAGGFHDLIQKEASDGDNLIQTPLSDHWHHFYRCRSYRVCEEQSKLISDKKGEKVTPSKQPTLSFDRSKIEIHEPLRFASKERYAAFLRCTLPSSWSASMKVARQRANIWGLQGKCIDERVNDQYVMMLWPSYRQFAREAKKVSEGFIARHALRSRGDGLCGDKEAGGVAASALRDLRFLQHVHYYSPPRAHPFGRANDRSEVYFRATLHCGINATEVVLQPLAVTSVKLESFSLEKEDLKEHKEEKLPRPNAIISSTPEHNRNGTNVSNGLSVDGAFGDSLLSLLPSKRSYSSSSSSSLEDGSSSMKQTGDALETDFNSNSEQLKSSSFKFCPLKECLAVVVPSSQISFPLSSVADVQSEANVSASWYQSICHDIFSATEHCVSCGVVFKYMSLSHFIVTSFGRVLLCNFAGAEMLPLLPSSNATDKHSQPSSGDRSKGIGFEGNQGNVAPEVFFGAAPTDQSSIWTAAVTCCHLITGTPLIRNAPTDSKQVQYIYSILGTPGNVGYSPEAFSRLPRSRELGKHVIDKKSGKKIETSNRVCKILHKTCHRNVLREFCPQGAKHHQDGSDNSAFYMLARCSHLVPEKRSSFKEIFTSVFFESDFTEKRANRSADIAQIVKALEKKASATSSKH